MRTILDCEKVSDEHLNGITDEKYSSSASGDILSNILLAMRLHALYSREKKGKSHM